MEGGGWVGGWLGGGECIYDAVMLRRLTCGSGFAAVSIAGITQTYLKENNGL